MGKQFVRPLLQGDTNVIDESVDAINAVPATGLLPQLEPATGDIHSTLLMDGDIITTVIQLHSWHC